ncbi:MAG: hypothetical protein AAGA46_00185 [Cyanobacteria bacterium P01_F01_bin.13]
MTSAIVYDCEIIKCIPPRDGTKNNDLAYCNGWDDHANMGISVIGAYDYLTGQLKAYVEEEMCAQIPGVDSFASFQQLVDNRERVIGFNSLSFDDKLCKAHDIWVKTDYDLLCEIRMATGQSASYTKGKTRAGYSLDAMASANLDTKKTGHGALAPVLWQQGQYYEVIRYGLNDVMLTKKLFDKRASLIDPTNQATVTLREPLGI